MALFHVVTEGNSYSGEYLDYILLHLNRASLYICLFILFQKAGWNFDKIALIESQYKIANIILVFRLDFSLSYLLTESVSFVCLFLYCLSFCLP